MKLQVGCWITINLNGRDERALVLCIKKEFLVIMLKNQYNVIINWSVIDDRIIWEYGKRFDDFMDMSEYITEKTTIQKNIKRSFSNWNWPKSFGTKEGNEKWKMKLQLV